MIVEYYQGGVGVRKIKNLFPIIMFTLGHAALISLGAVCFLNVAAIVLTPFGSTGSYPRFLPFCVIMGLTALFAWMYLTFRNARYFLNHDTHLRLKIALEVTLTILLAPAGIWLWENLLGWLQRVV